MISVTDLHGKEIFVNPGLVEQVSATPDTQILLTNGHRIYVTESPAVVAERITLYHRECLAYSQDKKSSNG